MEDIELFHTDMIPLRFLRLYMFNVSHLTKVIGINGSLLRQYKTGKVYISED